MNLNMTYNYINHFARFLSVSIFDTKDSFISRLILTNTFEFILEDVIFVSFLFSKQKILANNKEILLR